MKAVAARREVVRQLQELGLSERQARRLVGMSASTLRYQPRDDGNGKLRERLTQLAGQHRRHGYRMLHNRLRFDGWAINVKRTYRIYREEGLMVRKRRRKKLPVPERQPLVRPTQPNEVWSMDFVFDELANGRRVKTLTVVDDCSKEVVQIAVDTSIPALYVARVLDQVAAQRGLPKVIRTDNGPEFAGRTMQAWAARNGVELRFTQRYEIWVQRRLPMADGRFDHALFHCLQSVSAARGAAAAERHHLAGRGRRQKRRLCHLGRTLHALTARQALRPARGPDRLSPANAAGAHEPARARRRKPTPVRA